MRFIEWCDLLSIGHPTIDEQHQSLFEIINKFHHEIINRFPSKVIFETLNHLIGYAQYHFKTEEELLEKHKYPDDSLMDHKAKHENLVLDIFRLNEDLAKDQMHSKNEIEKFLTNWLILHILIEDRKFKDHLDNSSILQGVLGS
jgi:hemerythrin